MAAGPAAQARPLDQTPGIMVTIESPTNGASLDAPGALGGWAVDTRAMGNTGIASIAVYMDGDQTNGQFLGQAEMGGARPDVGAAFGNPAFNNAGWNFNLASFNISGVHTFTVVATSMMGDMAAAAVSPVTIVTPAMAMPPAPPAMSAQGGQLQVQATLSNVSYLFGQNYWNTLPQFNGYLYPGLTLPNGTTVNSNSYIQNGQLHYSGQTLPVDNFIQPAYANNMYFNGSFNYNTRLPNGAQVPYGTPTNYWAGYNWTALNNNAALVSNDYTTNDTIAINPFGAGYQLGLTLPPAPPEYYTGQAPNVLVSPSPNVLPAASAAANDPGLGGFTMVNPGNGAYVSPSDPNTVVGGNNVPQIGTNPNNWWANYNFNGTAGLQATLVARVAMDGQPVQGAQVTYQGYQLPPTDANGLTTTTVMFPINPSSDLNTTVTATYNGMSAQVPVLISYNR